MLSYREIVNHLVIAIKLHEINTKNCKSNCHKINKNNNEEGDIPRMLVLKNVIYLFCVGARPG